MVCFKDMKYNKATGCKYKKEKKISLKDTYLDIFNINVCIICTKVKITNILRISLYYLQLSSVYIIQLDTKMDSCIINQQIYFYTLSCLKIWFYFIKAEKQSFQEFYTFHLNQFFFEPPTFQNVMQLWTFWRIFSQHQWIFVSINISLKTLYNKFSYKGENFLLLNIYLIVDKNLISN